MTSPSPPPWFSGLEFWICLIFVFVLFSFIATTLAKKTPPYDSTIYCHGPLLHMVQMSHIYTDDKTFVDQPLKFAPSEVLQNFSMFVKLYPNPGQAEIRQFVDDNFYPNGHEFVPWTPTDWHKNPKFLSQIADEKLRAWATDLHGMWKDLGRTIKEDCKLRPERYSILYVPHPFIIPGGRFREFYYWDSYWIQRGLLRSEMTETVRGMIQNFLGMVESMGYVPNGGRIYYRRSQPPLLISMMKSYVDATGDLEFLQSNIKTLEKEFKFWLKNRMVSISIGQQKYRVARYSSDRTGPRPESYSVDYEWAQKLDSGRSKDDFYADIQSAAESGWDFSSRWFISEGAEVKGNRSNIQTRDIIPVDLNSLLFLNAKILATFFMMFGDRYRAGLYSEIARNLHATIQNVFWDEKLGSYFDYNMVNGRLVTEFYASSFLPLWTGVDTSPDTVSRMLSYFTAQNVFGYDGGLPTSVVHTGEQWDFPNGWPPLIHIAIEALVKTRHPTAQAIALNLTDKWIRSNFKAFYQRLPHTMFEKYDVTKFGEPGSGGEYSVVTGFGWTNGIVLDLLAEFGNILTA